MSALLELAARCEASTGPDAELDCRIRAAVERAKFPDAAAFRMGRTWGVGALKGKGRGWRAFGLHFEMRRYTASLDAAMTLVPEGSLYAVRTVWDGDKVSGFASVSRYELGEFNGHPRRYWMDEHQAVGFSPALALCAAALRARATGEQP